MVKEKSHSPEGQQLNVSSKYIVAEKLAKVNKKESNSMANKTQQLAAPKPQDDYSAIPKPVLNLITKFVTEKTIEVFNEQVKERRLKMKDYRKKNSNPELKSGKYTVVGVTRGLPKFNLGYELAGNLRDFGPPGWLFNENDRAVFTPQYFAYMDRIGIRRVKELLAPFKRFGKDIVLCCYEDVRIPNEWCHRLVFAEWFESKTGYRIEELPDSSGSSAATKEEQGENEVQQLSLFDIRL